MRITYISHSCFTLEYEDVILLFDYPSDRMLEYGAREVVKNKVDKSILYVFISHSHGDHYNPKIKKMTDLAKDVEFIVSRDVPLIKARIMDPGDNLELEHLSVEAFQSNDLGLAFVIKLKDKLIYYGGDLAKWDWDDFDSKTRDHMVQVFHKMIRHLSDLKVDVAFSNTDQRLESWAGPLEFLQAVDPEFFVPMHTFGNVEWIDDLLETTPFPSERIFKYKKPGDHLNI